MSGSSNDSDADVVVHGERDEAGVYVDVPRHSAIGSYMFMHWNQCRATTDAVARPLDAKYFDHATLRSELLRVQRLSLERATLQMNIASADARRAELLNAMHSGIRRTTAAAAEARGDTEQILTGLRRNEVTGRGTAVTAGTPWRYAGLTSISGAAIARQAAANEESGDAHVDVSTTSHFGDRMRAEWSRLRGPMDPARFEDLPRGRTSGWVSVPEGAYRRAHVVPVAPGDLLVVDVSRPRQSPPSPPRARRSTGGGALDERLDVEASDDATSCCACLVHVRCVVFMPCRHMCMCATCANRLRFTAAPAPAHCPKCRANVDDAIMVFL